MIDLIHEEVIGNDLVFNMIYVEGGEFMMGGQGIMNNLIHEVSLSDFYIGEHLVTQELWKAIMGDNPSNFKGDQRPVEMISWHQTKQFIKVLKEKTEWNYRLPTEAEWEYAARGGHKSEGYEYAGSSEPADVAWYSGNSKNETHEVGLKPSNELGIFDMNCKKSN